MVDRIDSVEDTVLNVEMSGDTLHLDALTTTWLGEVTYCSRTYFMGDYDGFNGMFNLLDDFFQRRVKFFNSSKSVQRLLMALSKSEKMFYYKTGKTLVDCYKAALEHSVLAVNTQDEFINHMTEFLSGGYGIEFESAKSRNYIRSFWYNIPNIIDVTNTFVREFSHHECCDGVYVCINNFIDNCPMFFMDGIVEMPMLFHSHEYALSFMDNVMIPYATSCMTDDDIPIVVEIAKIRDDTPLSGIMEFCENGGIVGDGFRKSFLLEDIQ